MRALAILLVLSSTAYADDDAPHRSPDSTPHPFDVPLPDEVDPPPAAPEPVPAPVEAAPEPGRVVVGTASSASPPPVYNFALHVNFGMEFLGSSDTTSVTARTHVGFSEAVFGARGRIRPTIGLGATIGAGILNVQDKRGLDGTVDIGHVDYGPELTLGLRFVDGGFVDSRVFASVAYLHTDLDKRLMLDPIAGVVGITGMRASIGANWADKIGGSMYAEHHHHDRHDLDADFLMVLIPQQFELVWERSAGSDRIGATLSWGI